ncbi:MAG: SDR family NAD(P)-dependent oxidoreductase [Pseudomonadota bacterium]
MADQVAIITGASSGIGAAAAKMMAESGIKVVANYAGNAAGAAAVVEACEAVGGEAIAVQGDVSQDHVCRDIINECMDRFGGLDILINNAGMTRAASMADMDAVSADDFSDLYSVNLIGVYQMVRAALPQLKASANGAVVNTSSIAGLTGLGSSVAYAASKGALNTLTQSLARSLAPDVRVNGICPGFVDSEWWAKQHDEEMIEKLRQRAISTTLLRRTVSSEDCAEAILFFALGAKSITGQLLTVDNGLTLNMGQPLADSQ